jgi:hypothetical protein
MNDDPSTAVRIRGSPLPDDLSQAVAPVTLQLAHAGEALLGVRIGPSKPVSEFLDFEGVRLRLALDQGGQPLPGQANLVERLGTLPPKQPITYVILETATRQAKCYVEPGSRQVVGVLWLPGASGGVEATAFLPPQEPT